ncbi:DUF2254 domain-containing protein [Sphingomonas echinoides]|uniref:DUF2254 domain-containing protein n=1 Tax=Sphingomonas echinoides TaxID=59803 RepID=UPI002413836D|nr:DUF2254 domain-containing protein [Sphingomonas echinoides]
MKRWTWIIHRIIRQIWFRAGIISLLSVALAILAGVITPYLPYAFDVDIGQRSVGTILQIMASSMLAVTTFSLTAMVSAYSSATQLATPRATQLMVSDPTSQNALSTFLGAFVFSMVGIVGLNTSAYGHDGRIILFAATVLIILLVVGTLLRWIGHITAFGRMADVIDRVEEAATQAMAEFAAAPHLGGSAATAVPPNAVAIAGSKTGYVTHIDIAALKAIAEREDLSVHVGVLPGMLVHPARDLVQVEGVVDEATRGGLVKAFTIERHRSFDQDPRLGLIALSEIASRALAPATNDPGTGIEVLNALLRVFLTLGTQPSENGEKDKHGHRVYLGRPSIEDMLTDAFGPILREGGREIEVSLRLTATLAAMHANLPTNRTQIESWAVRHAKRARETMDDADDLAVFESAYARLWPAST